MKQLTIFITLFLFLSSCKKDTTTTPEPQVNYFTFNGEIGTNDNSTFISSDDNLIMCGNYENNLSILKITKEGSLIWRKEFDCGMNSIANGIVETSSHELFVCGNTSRNYSTSKYDFLLVKTTFNGDTLWTKSYGGIASDYSANVIATSDGNLLISGKTESFGAGSFGDIYLIKVNTNGDTLWTRSYPDPDQEVAFHLMETQNGEYLVTGTNEDNSNPRELYLLKVNAAGDQIWNKKIGPSTWKWGFSTIELSDGSLITCGQHTANGNSQVLLVKTDNLGNVLWEKEFGDSNLSEKGYSIKQNADGSFSITGSSYDVNTMKTAIILLKVDANGNQLFLNKFGSSQNGIGNNLLKDSNDDNIIITIFIEFFSYNLLSL